ncbi:type IX secretion system outer membrane channel protein PorV [Arcticibacter sp.]|uniref:type IX secretion system outer membrane channel protein PorV n=1 Tax=Arcticibacter sp. TaxID=1872630 RepID=UPI00388FBD81
MIFCSLRSFLLVFVLLWLYVLETTAQSSANGLSASAASRKIPTAVPFLRIAPDAKIGAMGDAGVATPADANALYSNPSKIAYAEEKAAVAISYSPWLRELSTDMYITYLGGYHQIDNKSALGISAKYFSMGEIQLRDELFSSLGSYRATDLAFDATYARRFGSALSLATTFRFISSNIPDLTGVNGQSSTSATALAVDISAYHKSEIVIGKRAHGLAFGMNISNIGNKLSYLNSGEDMFLPTNLKLGSALTINPGSPQQLLVALDLNKLLVPTPPRLNAEGEIVAGRNTERSVVSGILGSFSDAPGGFSEEISEVSVGIGLEYLIYQRLAIRGGFSYESPDKGNRRYLTAGAGYQHSFMKIDFSYLFSTVPNSPLANSLRISLMYAFQ